MRARAHVRWDAAGGLGCGSTWRRCACAATTRRTPSWATPSAALARLVKKRYLIREKLHGATDAAGGDLYGVALAERARDEIGVDGVEKFVAGIMRGAEDAQDPDAGDAGEEPRDAEDDARPGTSE